jgi:small subunit ribosomal protein S17
MSYLGKRKVREGLVVSDKMDKTVVVAVETKRVHPLYKKAVRVTKRYKAHDETNACKIGDKVKIVETRPLSREKSWRVTEIISKREVVETGPKKPKKKK